MGAKLRAKRWPRTVKSMRKRRRYLDKQVEEECVRAKTVKTFNGEKTRYSIIQEQNLTAVPELTDGRWEQRQLMTKLHPSKHNVCVSVNIAKHAAVFSGVLGPWSVPKYTF